MSEKTSSNNIISYTSLEQIELKVERQREYFQKNMSLDINTRENALKKLLKEINKREEDITEALHLDFRKSSFEAFETEIGLAKSELRYAIKKIKKWSSRSFQGFSILSYPSRLYSEPIPFGNTLIISPWNYPFLLSIAPLIGSIAAGNTAIIKPSELTVHTSRILEEIIINTFDPGHVDVVQGSVEESQALLSYSFNFVFFTGSTAIGKIVYEKAAAHLCPVLLELGGKSPCIINQDADLDVTAKRIVWGKFLNGGQTCVAPDYLIVHKEIKEQLIDRLIYFTKKFYGEQIEKNTDYPRIINEKNFDRLVSYLSEGKRVFGGNHDKSDLYIEPSIIEIEGTKNSIMEEEIFGPILPILSFESILDINTFIQQNAKPLALYVFTDDEDFANRVISQNPSGDACINDVVSQFGEKKIGVGGIGSSGIGKYRGRKSFEVFSHSRSILKRSIWPDLPLRYPPYKGKLGLIKTLLNKL